jgi:transposase
MRQSIKKNIKNVSINDQVTQKTFKQSKKQQIQEPLKVIHPNAAGIDIGSRSHYVALPVGRAEERTKEFDSCTPGVKLMSLWLKEHQIDTVAMEATGVYWIPVYEFLEQEGFEVILVNAFHVKNVPGRPKSDVLDCQWIQRLHESGLLRGAFRPDDQFVVLRSYIRQRHDLIEQRSVQVLRMQKAFSLMNVQLHNVIRDITGMSGMRIIQAILSGERNPEKLAALADDRCANSKEVIAQSLVGNFRKEHLFALKQSMECYMFYQGKIIECEKEIEKALKGFSHANIKEEKCLGQQESKEQTADQPTKKLGKRRIKKNYHIDLREQLLALTKVDLTRIPGIDIGTTLKIVSEIGTDMSKWPTVKHFTSWLGLCPGTKISGGKRISGATKPCANKAAAALRMAASSLYRSKSALGAFLRRKRGQIGPAKAVTATAHKMAQQIYHMLKEGQEYVEIGQEYYEKQYKKRLIRGIERRAKELGYKLVPIEKAA